MRCFVSSGICGRRPMTKIPMHLSRHLLCFMAGMSIIATSSANVLPGELDPTFGDEGVAILANSSVHPFSQGRSGLVAEAPSGALYVLADTVDDADTGLPQIARLDADGRIDLSFGTQGIATPSFGNSVSFDAMDVMIDSEGRLLIVGQMLYVQASGGDMAACRFLADGTPDLTFGVPSTPGCVSQRIVDFSLMASAVLEQACPQADTCIDGKRLVVAGWVDDGDTPQTKFGIVLAWKLDGSGVDTSFYGSGISPIGQLEPKPNEFVDIEQDASGHLVVAGNRYHGEATGTTCWPCG